MPNLYQFVSRKAVQPTAESILNAESVSSVADFIAVAKKAGEYEFTSDKNDASVSLIQSVMKDAVSVRIWSEKTTDGVTVTRGESTLASGAKIPFRTYGHKGEAVAESTLTDKAKIANLVWGVCYQDGSLIEETKHTNGKCTKFPVPYLKLA